MSESSSTVKKSLFPQFHGESRYLFLLVSLLLLFFFYPFFEGFRFATRLLGGVFLFILLSAVSGGGYSQHLDGTDYLPRRLLLPLPAAG